MIALPGRGPPSRLPPKRSALRRSNGRFGGTAFARLAQPKLTLQRSLASAKAGAPGRARTCGLLVRSQSLYPTELRARGRA